MSDNFSDGIGLQRIREKVPYVQSAEGAGDGVKKVFTDKRRVQLVTINPKLPYLEVERLASPDEAGDGAAPVGAGSYYEAARQSQMAEYVTPPGESPAEQLFRMFDLVQAEGLVVGNILLGSIRRLRKWVSFSRQRDVLFGIPLQQVSEIPEDVIILCGALERDAKPEDVEFCLKGNIA